MKPLTHQIWLRLMSRLKPTYDSAFLSCKPSKIEMQHFLNPVKLDAYEEYSQSLNEPKFIDSSKSPKNSHEIVITPEQNLCTGLSYKFSTHFTVFQGPDIYFLCRIMSCLPKGQVGKLPPARLTSCGLSLYTSSRALTHPFSLHTVKMSTCFNTSLICSIFPRTISLRILTLLSRAPEIARRKHAS